MGLAAALGAIERGCQTTVLERDEVGASLRTWGPTRFFTPLRMNVSPAMRAVGGDNLQRRSARGQMRSRGDKLRKEEQALLREPRPCGDAKGESGDEKKPGHEGRLARV